MRCPLCESADVCVFVCACVCVCVCVCVSMSVRACASVCLSLCVYVCDSMCLISGSVVCRCQRDYLSVRLDEQTPHPALPSGRPRRRTC